MTTETRIRRVRRSDDAVNGNLVRVGTPKTLTLTAKPANQRPFPVVRSDNGETMTTPTTAKRVARTAKRSDENPVLKLTFPAGYTQDDVNQILIEYDMTGYVVKLEGTQYIAVRSDLQSIANPTTDIKLNDAGVIASLDANQYAVQQAQRSDNLKLVAFEFDAKRYDENQVSTWLTQNGVDIAQDSVENSGNDVIAVKRSDIAEGTDTRRVQLDEGVVAVVARADVEDMPEKFAAVVNEAAYGSWGWGHLDFNASMADRAFCELMDDATYRLRSVLDQIIFYSSLPLDARTQLINRSLAQFGDFVGNVMDALPRQVMLLVSRAAETPKQESNTMTTTNQGAAAAAPAATAAQTDTVTISRSELSALIAEQVKAATVAPATTTEAKRSDEAAAAAAPAAGEAAAAPTSTEAPAAAAAPAAATVTRSDLEAVVAAALAPVMAKVDEINNTVIVRSDGGDPSKQVQVKRSVFAGAIPGLPGSK